MIKEKRKNKSELCVLFSTSSASKLKNKTRRETNERHRVLSAARDGRIRVFFITRFTARARAVQARSAFREGEQTNNIKYRNLQSPAVVTNKHETRCQR